MTVDDAVKRWLKAYGNMDVALDSSYDHELDSYVSSAESDVLLEFVGQLLTHDLRDSTRAFLGAGIFEGILENKSFPLSDFEQWIKTNDQAKDVLSYVWPNDRMSAAALDLLAKNDASWQKK